MRILIANDDGIYSPGLLALAHRARSIGEVRIFAPDVEQSSMGLAVTHSRPLHVKRTTIGDFEAWRVNGTPADCVALGMNSWSEVGLVLAGINLGLNLGNAAWHSGTLGAARQAVLLGARGVAFSTPTGGGEPDFTRLDLHIDRVLRLVIADPTLRLLNVNLPADPAGMIWTRQSVRHYDGGVVPGTDPMGRKHYWLTAHPHEEVEEGTDRWAIANGLVALTPLRLDLTDEAMLTDAKARHRLDDREAKSADGA